MVKECSYNALFVGVVSKATDYITKLTREDVQNHETEHKNGTFRCEYRICPKIK